ncbi:MAG: PBP1A family penicillin-binding protein [Stappiaceae bacterium]
MNENENKESENRTEKPEIQRSANADLSLGERLLIADSWFDTALFKVGNALMAIFTGYSAFCRRFRVRRFKRVLAELGSDGLTWGLGGLIVLLAFAQPAFEETRQDDWRTTDDFSVTFLDRNGAVIGKRGILLNDTVPLEEIPDYLIKATLATEDRRFFDHFGIDFIGTARAMVANVRAKSVVQGGSSITQQLAKNLFLSNERTLQRKVKEAYLAFWLEATLTKREILKLYLDRAYMGAGTFGVVAAADFYFGKSVKELTLAESAMLAGLYKAPTKYAPHSNLPAARLRANEVLGNMVEAGFLTEGQVLAARRRPAEAVDRTSAYSPDNYLDYAFEEVKKIAKSGNDRILTVRTTLDLDTQKQADKAVLTTLREQGLEKNVSQAALVSLQPDGAVVAMVGGNNYDQSQFNRATNALRQPGSSFKPFVYMTAFLNNFKPESVISDRPISIGGWSPQNYTRRYAGSVTLKRALSKSYNTVPVRLAQAIGRDKIVEVAHKMGISTELLITRALPLGVAEVTVVDMAAAYAVFSNGGFKAYPYTITEVKDSKGRLVWDIKDAPITQERVLPEEQVFQMNDVLNDVVLNGTGRRAQLEGVNAAGKTGTTQAYRDAWFVGYTGNFTTAVWFGNDNYSPTNRVTGGSLPAMTWQAFMSYAQSTVPAKPIPGVEPTPLEQAAKVARLEAELLDDTQSAPSKLSSELEAIIRNINTKLIEAQSISAASLPAKDGAVGNRRAENSAPQNPLVNPDPT